MAEQLTHWKKLRDPRYLGVYSLEEGKNIIVTIATIGVEKVIVDGGKKENHTIIHWKEPNVKPMMLNATNGKTIAKLLKTNYIERWVGARIELYADYNVKYAGEITEGLRVKPALPPPEHPVCRKCNSDILATAKMNPLQVAEHTQRTYGMPLCVKCAKIEYAARESTVSKDVLDGTEQSITESTVTGQADESVTNNNNESENPINEDN